MNDRKFVWLSANHKFAFQLESYILQTLSIKLPWIYVDIFFSPLHCSVTLSVHILQTLFCHDLQMSEHLHNLLRAEKFVQYINGKLTRNHSIECQFNFKVQELQRKCHFIWVNDCHIYEFIHFVQLCISMLCNYIIILVCFLISALSP